VPGDAQTGDFTLNARAFGKDDKGSLLESQVSLSFHYADQKDVDAALTNQGLMERFGIVELADSATEALKLERAGQREAASRTMQDSINRNRPHISPMAAQRYEDLSSRMGTGMSEEDRKQTHYDQYNIKRKKEEDEGN